MADRRSFLRGLVSLPLIGGSVTLVGNPTAAAVPVTDGLLRNYEAWLAWERYQLQTEIWGRATAENCTTFLAMICLASSGIIHGETRRLRALWHRRVPPSCCRRSDARSTTPKASMPTST